jgi:hypothetical protein
MLVAAVVMTLVVSAGASSASYAPPELSKGHVEEPAEGSTVISVQGYNINGQVNPNKPARLVSVGQNGSLEWELPPDRFDVSWFYDVDPLANGDLLVVGTIGRETRVTRLDPENDTIVWNETLPLWDTYDVTLTEEGNLLVANMRNNQNGSSQDRIFVYNRTSDEVEWEWRFADRYDNGTAGGIGAEDWTHVNDVDVVAPGLYMLSPRNFDEVIVVDRSTGDVVMRLGTDGDHDVLYEQHNPSFVETEDGRPAILVADSENDRVVEYTCDRGDPDHPLDGDMEPNCDWNKTWEVGVGQLEWPRDADRLPNGNTLVVDTRNHRVVEVTPEGEIVWEYYAPWMPFDVERPVHGHEPRGPAMADLNASGSYALSGGGEGAVIHDDTLPKQVQHGVAGLPGGGPVSDLVATYRGAAPWVRPVWMSPDGLFLLVVALLISLVWATTEGFLHRRAIVAHLRQVARRLRTGSGAS